MFTDDEIKSIETIIKIGRPPQIKPKAVYYEETRKKVSRAIEHDTFSDLEVQQASDLIDSNLAIIRKPKGDMKKNLSHIKYLKQLLIYFHDKQKLQLRYDKLTDKMAFRVTMYDIKLNAFRSLNTQPDDEWQDETHRTIKSIKALQEISLVPIPAYEGTDIIAKRSLAMSEKTNETEQETQPDLQAEIDELKAQIEALQTDDEGNAEDQKSTDSTDDEVRDDDVLEENSNTPKKGEQRNMQEFNKAKNTESQEVRNFNAYLKGEIEKRDLNTTNGAPIIPQELLSEQYQPQASTGVLSKINTVSVDSNNVTLPVVKHATKGFTEVSAEGADTSNVDAPAIQEVNFDLKLYSGALPMSYQLAHSSKSAQRVILQHITAMRDLTRLQKVGALLKTATPKAVKSIDDIKDVYNDDSFVNYPDANKSFIMTAELFAELDKAKDSTGAYILQPLATDATKKSIGGYPVEVVSSDVLGAGKVAFFGDAKAFIVEAINQNMIFTYQENRNLSTVAVGGVFFDTKVADSDAGVFITFGAE